GKFKLQSSRFVSLYLAAGLFDTGQGESVVALRITSNSNVFNFSLPRVVSVSNSFCSRLESLSSSNLYRCRLRIDALSNISLPFSRKKLRILSTVMPQKRHAAMTPPVLVPAKKSK